ncbi:MAG TPA: hypothetical protein PLF13_03665 [candidate division Zixibacteria bacterium]|nr:hypothetical protein [candidate division Zixibacteria bacterium]
MAIDRKKIINELSGLQVRGDDQGLIPAYGVLVQRIPVSFWNGFSKAILDAAGDDVGDAAEGLLENAAAECGYHTGHGIITSEEFQAVVSPMVEKEPEDILHGAYGVLTAWGWANAEITELIPDEKMVIRACDYYEHDMGPTKRPFAFMIRGVSRAFMDLAYGDPYPNGFGRFKCEQTRGIEVGDEYGEFVVTRA